MYIFAAHATGLGHDFNDFGVIFRQVDMFIITVLVVFEGYITCFGLFVRVKYAFDYIWNYDSFLFLASLIF